MKFKKEYTNIMEAFLDYHRVLPCVKGGACDTQCPFYSFQQAFDISCAGFCSEYPVPAARIMNLEIVEDESENEGC